MTTALQDLPTAFDAESFTAVCKGLDTWAPLELVPVEVAMEMPARTRAWFADQLVSL